MAAPSLSLSPGVRTRLRAAPSHIMPCSLSSDRADDQEIGYVQALNLVSSTLLLLLDGDEEGAFWTLVTLLRQLPPNFYARAPIQLLGFWTEVEVLSQLAARLLGLGERERVGVRHALLQVAPRWLLQFWVGTLPLEMVVMIWDHMLRSAHASSPSLIGLQVCLVLLLHLKPQLHQALRTARHERIGRTDGGSGRFAEGLGGGSEASFHRAFALLQSVRVPDASAGWLLQRALQVRLNPVTVQDMRLHCRISIEERCSREPGSTLPFTEPLPDVTPDAGAKPLPILQPATLRPSSLRGGAALIAALRSACRPQSLVHLVALSLACTALVASAILWEATLDADACGTRWEVEHVDDLAIMVLVVLSIVVGWRYRSARPAVALGTSVASLFFASKAISVLLVCMQCHPSNHNHTAIAHISIASSAGLDLAQIAPPPPPPPCQHDDCTNCWSLRRLWPAALCGLVALVASLQVGSACAVLRGPPRVRLQASGLLSNDYTAWQDVEASAGGRERARTASRNAARAVN